MRDRTLKARTIVFALAADVCFGDPRWLPHPVRAIGWCALQAQPLARRFACGDAVRERIAGSAISAIIVGGAGAICAAAVRGAVNVDANLGEAVEIAVAWTTLAVRDLLAESRTVREALEHDDLPLARSRVARIVGRDTDDLSRCDIARAAIETLAESFGDGIVGPLAALCVGGAPAAIAFKAASTLDSILGHREAPYTHLGYASAKLDDVLCYLPSRLAALAICLTASFARGDAMRAIRTWRADGHRHASPNAGGLEAAMAGALGVRLGGPNRYDGVSADAPLLGAPFAAPDVCDIARAERIVVAATVVCACLTIVARTCIRYR